MDESLSFFRRIHCKNSKDDFFLSQSTLEKACPFCGAIVKIETKFIDPGISDSFLVDISGRHKWERGTYSRQLVIKISFLSKCTVIIENKQGIMVSFLKFLAEQPEFQKRELERTEEEAKCKLTCR